MLDVVYPYKNSNSGLELRYSLRSLVNLPHRNVWIVGDRPRGLDNVNFIDIPQKGEKYYNALNNIKQACLEPRISEDFILMNDDFFVMEPQEELKHYHRGDFVEYMAGYPYAGSYYALMCQTLDLLEREGVTDTKFYGLHIPTVFNKTKVLELLERFEGERFMLRTLYHNWYKTGGELRKDVKKSHSAEHIEGTDFLSTSDRYALSDSFNAMIQQRFPNPCYYEQA